MGQMLPLVAYQKLSEDDDDEREVWIGAFVANRRNQNRLEKPTKEEDWLEESSAAAAAPVSDVDRSVDRLQSDRFSPSSLYGDFYNCPGWQKYVQNQRELTSTEIGKQQSKFS